MVVGEPETTAWFAMKMGPRSFGIFDAFANEHGRQAHLQGKVAQELMAKAPQLFEKAPQIHRIEILADYRISCEKSQHIEADLASTDSLEPRSG